MRIVLNCFYLFLSTLILANSALAGWNEEALRWQDDYDFKMDDGFLSTVWGSCHSPNPSYNRIDARVHNWNVVSNELYFRTLPTKMALVEDNRGRVKKAPVMLFVPGAFSNLNEKMPKHFMDRFTRLGYHTIVVPNPWGTDYISRKPRTITGHIEAEAGVLFTVLKRVKEYMDDMNYSNGDIHVSGVSYGAFLSAMLGGMAAEEGIELKSVTMISPPLKLGKSLDHLDYILDETVNYTTMWIPKLLKKYVSLCRVDSDGVGNYSHKDAMGLAAAQGFHTELIESLRLYDRLWNLDTIPQNFWSRLTGKYRNWRKTMSFGKYFRLYNRGASEIIDGPRGDILYWINRARSNPETEIQMLLASDDFLNDERMIKSLETELSHEELIELPRGGHFGFRALDWFDDFLERAFVQEN